MAVCPRRPPIGPPVGASRVQVGVAPSDSSHTWLTAGPGNVEPPNMIIRSRGGSYMAVAPVRGAGGVPAGVSAAQRGLGDIGSNHTSPRLSVLYPPYTIIRSSCAS